jgi:cellulose synthase/poly-beta-1,6-N-acetylglucosamine synthase-like glycosyltransferase
MSRRRSDIRSARPDAGSPGGSFSPIRLLQLDLDTASAGTVDVRVGTDRVWVEACRGGHVVGVAELATPDGTLSADDLAAITARFPREGPRAVDLVADAQLPSATVVVPTICRTPDRLVRTVNSLLSLDYPQFDVVIVDNRPPSSDDALPALPGGDRVRVVREPLRGISAARNRGLSLARGELVAFTDDDVEVDTRWLRYLGARFAVEPAADVVSGLVLPLELQTRYQLWFEEFYGGFSQSFQPMSWSTLLAGADDVLFPYAPGRFGAGCNMAFRRAALQRVGGFDPALGTGTPARGGEDLAIFVTLLVDGATVAFEPAAVVRHAHRRTEEAFFRQVRSYGVGLTAMYASLVARDRRHLTEILRRVAPGVRLLVRPRDERSPSRVPSYPRRTLLFQMLGMALGPFAYLQSRRWVSSRT